MNISKFLFTILLEKFNFFSIYYTFQTGMYSSYKSNTIQVKKNFNSVKTMN
jgi:hypothetical protein